MKNIISFITYICTADDMIHNLEMEEIIHLLKDNDIDEDIQVEIEKILGDTDDKQPFKEIITHSPLSTI